MSDVVSVKEYFPAVLIDGKRYVYISKRKWRLAEGLGENDQHFVLISKEEADKGEKQIGNY